MCDTPVRFFGEVIPPYFTMLMVGFGLAIFLGVRWARRTGVSHDAIIDLGLYSVLLGVIGARLLSVIADGYFFDYVHLCTDPARVAWHVTRAECASLSGAWDAAAGVCHPTERDCFAWAAFWQGGLTYYGGLILTVPFALWFLRREKMPVLKVADMGGMVIPLGLFWGRLGCFLGGCCFGKTTSSPLGLRFPAWSPASRKQWEQGLLSSPGQPSLPVHPTQLYESLGCLGIAAVLMLLLHPRKRFDGEVLLAFLASYAALRFGLEFLRADDRGGMLGLSTSQLIGIAVILGVAATWAWLHRNRRMSKNA